MISSEAMILSVLNTIFSNCVEKTEKFRTSIRFEPVTSQWWCSALRPTELWNHRWELVICGFKCSCVEWINEKKFMYEKKTCISKCRYEIKQSHDPPSLECNFSNCIEKSEKCIFRLLFHHFKLRVNCREYTSQNGSIICHSC